MQKACHIVDPIWAKHPSNKSIPWDRFCIVLMKEKFILYMKYKFQNNCKANCKVTVAFQLMQKLLILLLTKANIKSKHCYRTFQIHCVIFLRSIQSLLLPYFKMDICSSIKITNSIPVIADCTKPPREIHIMLLIIFIQQY